MDKFESKAKELLSEVEGVLDKKSQGQDLRRDTNLFSNAVNEGALKMILRTQTLFYLYDPTMPLYLRSLRLGEMVEKHYTGLEFDSIRDLLEVFLEMIAYQED